MTSISESIEHEGIITTKKTRHETTVETKRSNSSNVAFILKEEKDVTQSDKKDEPVVPAKTDEPTRKPVSEKKKKKDTKRQKETAIESKNQTRTDDKKTKEKTDEKPNKTSSKKKKSKKKKDTTTTDKVAKNETTTKVKSKEDTIIKEPKNETITISESKHDDTAKPPNDWTKDTSAPAPPVQTQDHNNNNNTLININKSLIPPHDETKASHFLNRSCLLTHSAEWFPSSASSNDWQLRAPRFMILGARDSGMSVLSSLLLKHSSIISNAHALQQVAFFSQPTFTKMLSTHQVHVYGARQRMYARNYPLKLLKSNSSLITMDATPDYLFYSPTLPRSILCVCPWVKFIVVLSNPAHRVYASYQRALRKLKWTGNFSQYVRLDMETMERAGLVGLNKKENVEEAWRLYLKYTSTDGPVGRSFYEVQLQEWFTVLKDLGRDPMEAFHVMRLEEWNAHPQQEYQRVLDFLGLPYEERVPSSLPTLNVSSTLAGMSKEDEKTMTRLKTFFRPYNKRLYKLLGNGWDGCWDDA